MKQRTSCRALLSLMILLSTLSFTAHSAPDINIGTMFDYMDSDKSTMLKRVRNLGDSTAFVKVHVSEIVYDSDGEPIEQTIAPVLHGKENQGKQAPTLVASPSRLIVPANGMQATRLLHMGNRDKEHYYRLRFSPVLPEHGDDFDVSASQAEAYKQSLSADLTILTAYGAVLVVRPSHVQYKTQMQDEPTQFAVRNKGNSVIVLEDVKDCKTAAQECATPTRLHVRPGTKHVFMKEAGHDVRFDLIEGDRKEAVTFGK